MSPQPPHLPQDRAVNIPTRVQQAMDKHLQQTLPANLQYYQASGAYVPPHIQQQIQSHMQKSMPEHLKQYINPYMQQQVVPQHLGTAQGMHPPQFTPGQHMTTVVQDQPFPQPIVGGSLTPEQAAPETQNSQPPIEPSSISPPQEPYAFITDPEKPLRSAPSILGGKPLPARVAIIGGGSIALLLLLIILKGLFVAGFNVQPFVAVLQDQQELVHLSKNALQPPVGQAALPASYDNFLSNTQVTVTSAQEQLISYLATNKQKIKPQDLNLKVSTTIDNQFITSSANGIYTSTFQGTMTSKFNAYLSDLHQASIKTSGKQGHALLTSDYNAALLLVKQLGQASLASLN